MPKHNRPEVSEALRKRYDTDVPATFETIAPELVPVIIAEDLQARESVERYAHGGQISSAVAGQYSHTGIYNPVGSGVLVYVDRVTVYLSASGLFWFRRDGGLTTVSAQSQLQDRRLSPQLCAAQIRHETNAALQGAGIFRIRCLANTPIVIQLHAVLDENDGFNVANATVNADIGAVWNWREVNVS